MSVEKNTRMTSTTYGEFFKGDTAKFSSELIGWTKIVRVDV